MLNTLNYYKRLIPDEKIRNSGIRIEIYKIYKIPDSGFFASRTASLIAIR